MMEATPENRITDGIASQKNLVATFLGPIMVREDVTHKELCCRLDIGPAQLTQWLNGHDSIPQSHLIRIKEALYIDDEAFAVLSYVNGIVASRAVLANLLTGGRHGKQIESGHGEQERSRIFHYLSGGRQTISGVLSYAEKMARDDLWIYPMMNWTSALLKQIDAAVQIARDIDRFLQGHEPDIFHSRNILVHLRYPHNYHLGFYLHGIDPRGLPDLHEMQALLWECISSAADGIGSEDLTSNRIAQHATYLVSRYGNPSSLRYPHLLHSADLETRRMVLFGKVYREEDQGDFEALVQPINRDPEFSDLVVAFDGLHYGDSWRYKDGDRLRVPRKAFMRHLSGLGNEKAFIRHLSAARLNVLFQRFGRQMENDPNFLWELNIARARIAIEEVIEPSGRAMIDKIDALRLLTGEKIS